MSDIDLAVRRSKRLERLLRDGIGARGKGLHELTSSVERKLPAEVVKRLRFVATLRNKIVHDLDYTRLDDRDGFVQACDAAEKELERLAGPGVRDSWRLTILVVIVLAAFMAIGVATAIVMLRRRGMSLELTLW